MNRKDIWEKVYERNDLPWVSNPVPLSILNKFSSHFKPGDIILDYGGGDGVLAEILLKNGLNVVCSDISAKALALAKEKNPDLITIQASAPSEFVTNGDMFDGILVWGVLHHVDIEEWPKYFESFHKILKEDGWLLIGGHSSQDKEFKCGSRISPTTGLISHSINNIEEILPSSGFSIEETDYFEFEEAHTKSNRVFKYYLLKAV